MPAFRALTRRPGFAVAAIIALALGIGVSTAAYTVLRAFAFAPLPFRDADRLVWLQTQHATTGADLGASYADFRDWRTAGALAESAFLNVRWNGNLALSDGTRTETLRTTFCTWNLFEVLGVKPLLGRGLTAADDAPGAPRVVVIGHAVWAQLFAVDANVIGRRLRLDGEEREIVGVMPPGFRFPSQSALWIPMGAFFEQNSAHRGFRADQAIARLAPGRTVEAADAEVQSIGARLARDFLATNAEAKARVVSFREPGVAPVQSSLRMVMSASIGLLLVACANVAGLFFTRGLERTREFAVRLALGASRGSLALALAGETVVLGLLGGAGGLLLAAWLLQLVRVLLPVELPHWIELRLDTTVCAVAVATCVGCALASTLLAAWRALRIDLNAALKNGGASSTRTSRAHLGLVGIQVAVGFALTGTGAILVQRLTALQATSPGFDPLGVLLVEVNPTYRPEETAAVRVERFERMMAGIARLPGVQAVGCNNSVPFLPQRPWNRTDFTVEGQDETARRANPLANFQTVSADYFRALGIPILRGRAFEARDRVDTTPVAIISRALAERLFPNVDPIGRRLQPGALENRKGDAWRVIVGVAADIHHQSLEDAGLPDLYFAASQLAWKQTTFAIRAVPGVEPMSLLPAIEREGAVVAGDTGLFGARRLDDAVAGSLWQERLRSLAVASFGGAALLLTGFGLTALTAQSVLRRRREFGIRLALGATSRDLTGNVMQRTLTLTTVGIGVGAIFLAGAARALPVRDGTWLVAMGGAAAVLVGIALLAAWLPARRAAQVEATEVLRAE